MLCCQAYHPVMVGVASTGSSTALPEDEPSFAQSQCADGADDEVALSDRTPLGAADSDGGGGTGDGSGSPFSGTLPEAPSADGASGRASGGRRPPAATLCMVQAQRLAKLHYIDISTLISRGQGTNRHGIDSNCHSMYNTSTPRGRLCQQS
jgi:hypothetical protein